VTGNEYQEKTPKKKGFNTGKGALYFQNNLQGMWYNNNNNNNNNNHHHHHHHHHHNHNHNNNNNNRKINLDLYIILLSPP